MQANIKEMLRYRFVLIVPHEIETYYNTLLDIDFVFRY